MSEELIKVVNFDGFISHVSDSGESSEVIIYVAHVVSDDSKVNDGREIGTGQDLFNSGNHMNENGNNFGDVFTIRVGQCVERVAAKNFSENERLTKVRLIDKGIDVEVERNALFPSTSQAKIDADCMCPILVVDAGEEQREVAAQITGRECRCINGNLVVIPSVGLCVKGRLLISYGNGGYAELKDISLVPAEGQECSKFVMDSMPQANVDTQQSSEHEKSYHYHNDLIGHRRNDFENGGRYERKNDCNDRMVVYGDRCGHRAHTFINNSVANRWNNNQFEENSTIIEDNVPVSPRNRPSFFNANFDYDRIKHRNEMDEAYAMVPRSNILHEGRQRYSACPQFDTTQIHELSGMGCLVRASVDSGCRSLCRAEIIKFAENTHRFSVYLVDYGFYKWVKCNDVFDISVINKKDKILYLPVALLHCRLENYAGNGIFLQHLEKGGEYEIIIKSRDARGIFNVAIKQVDDESSGALTNIRNSVLSVLPDRNMDDLFPPRCSYSSSLQYTNEAIAKTFQRNVSIAEPLYGNSLVSTMIAKNMAFNSWSGFCGFGIPCPMIMPVMMPTMPNFGDSRDQRNQVCAQFGGGDDAFGGGDPFLVNRNMHSTNRMSQNFLRRANERTWNYEGSRYRTFERSGDYNYGTDFYGHGDLQARNSFGRFFKRNSCYWSERGERSGTSGRRCGITHESVYFNGPESSKVPSPRNYSDRFTDFERNESPDINPN
uniref:Tudor domain-containing protein n=1 Tax=Setaria digitata TaxID=48799 RepID=A0A915PNH5_9BILA